VAIISGTKADKVNAVLEKIPEEALNFTGCQHTTVMKIVLSGNAAGDLEVT
jgi:hypothetical protein